MTPKEKAIELYNKYFSMIKIESYIDRVSSIPYVKKCALIAVDELIANEHLEAGDASFWEPVKDELLKMK